MSTLPWKAKNRGNLTSPTVVISCMVSFSFPRWLMNTSILAHLTPIQEEGGDHLIDFKPLLQALVGPKNAKLAYRLFVLIKKYTGRYEQSPRYVICLNTERKQFAEKNRQRQLSNLAAALEKWTPIEEQTPVEIEQGLNRIFAGYKARYRKFFDIQRDPDSDKVIGYRLNEQQLAQEKLRDGIFILQTNREDLPAAKVVDSYKDLKEVEALFDDLHVGVSACRGQV